VAGVVGDEYVRASGMAPLDRFSIVDPGGAVVWADIRGDGEPRPSRES